MAFNFKQYRKQDRNYITLLASQPSAARTSGNKFIMDISGLNINTNYYIKLTLNHAAKKSVYSVQMLKDLNDETVNAQIVASFYLSENQTGEQVIDIVFKPIIADFQYLVISCTDSIVGDSVSAQIYTIYNIRNDLGNGEIKHIGIQSKPGLLLCLNGYPLRVGKTGLLEIADSDISFQSIGVVTTDDNFIIDYQWEG